jgi:hypothetical protein
METIRLKLEDGCSFAFVVDHIVGFEEYLGRISVVTTLGKDTPFHLSDGYSVEKIKDAINSGSDELIV